ncbi:MAG: Plug domain-containing protein, partial [Pyrinomonadaceae bacterium]|nr:Plug domain-containing protein [Pyrinomonadaceae bacterium]
NEVVTVVSDRETVQTNTATIGNVVDQRTIETLPLNGRNPLNLVLLEPGVVQRSGGAAGSGVHINGSRDRAFNVTIDGIDANESSVPNPVSNIYRINPDNVQEFKVTTNNATAEEGRNSGAAITLSTRTGGNGFHGTGFLFFRDSALNSTEFYANAQKLPKRETKLKQFGFELGGPIIKNKTFFFGSFQTNVIDFTQPIDQSFGTPIVYTAAARSGNFRYFRPDPANPLVIGTTTITRNSPLLVDARTGNLIAGLSACTTATQLGCVATYNIAANGPAGTTLNTTVGSYLNTLPNPNSYAFGDGLNTGAFLWNPPTSVRGPAYSARIDHNFSERDSIFGRFLYSKYNTLKGDPLNGRPQVFPGFAPLGEVFRTTSNLALGYRRTFSPYIVNDLRVGYSNFNFLFTQAEANPAFPDVSPINYNLISEPYNNTPRTQREVYTPQILDTLSIVSGAHVIGIGFNARFYRHRDRRGQPGGINLTPQISLLSSIRQPVGFAAAPLINSTDNTNLLDTINNLLGIPSRIQQTFIGDLERDVFLPFTINGKVTLFDELHLANQYNLYIQDEWKARSNLTLNYGVRWEINPAPRTASGKTYVAENPILNGPTAFVKADSWYKRDNLGAFGPSLGLAYSPNFDKGFLGGLFGGVGKSAIRLGYRIAYDPISTFQVTAAAGRVPGLLLTCSSTLGGATTPGCATAPDLRIGGGFPTQLPAPTLKPSSFLNLPLQLNVNAPPITVFDPSLKLPTVHQWSASFQRELPLKMVMQMSYVGRRGMRLYFAGNRNQINADRILPDFLIMQRNLVSGCLAGGTGCPTGVTGTVPALITSGVLTATFINSTTTRDELLLNAAGSFAERIENTTLALRLRPNQQFSSITYIDNSGDSNYHAFQFTLRRRFAQGLGLAAAYTFGKSIDNQSVDPVGAASGGGLSTTNARTPTDIRNLNEEKARSDFDRTHVFNLTAVWELPVGRGKSFLGDAPGWLNQIVGGWTINGISTYMSGEPFSVRSGVRTSNSGHESRAVVLDPKLKAKLQELSGSPGPVYFPNNSGFAIPLPGQNGAGRNIFVAAGYYNLDIGIIKQFSITERVKLDFRTEMFNILNRANFDNPRDASVGSPSIRSSVFAQACCATVAPPSTQAIIQTGESGRVIQFALKLKF